MNTYESPGTRSWGEPSTINLSADHTTSRTGAATILLSCAGSRLDRDLGHSDDVHRVQHVTGWSARAPQTQPCLVVDSQG